MAYSTLGAPGATPDPRSGSSGAFASSCAKHSDHRKLTASLKLAPSFAVDPCDTRAVLADALAEPDPDDQLISLLRGLDSLDELYLPADLRSPNLKNLRSSTFVQALRDACETYSLFASVNLRRRCLSRWAAAYSFCVAKKDGSARLIIDPQLNTVDARIDVTCPLPDVSSILNAASKSAYGCMVDMQSWFTQFSLGPEVSPFFTVSTGGRTWAYQRVPMGWRLAPALAQRALMFVLRKAQVSSGFVWIDNIVMFGDTEAQLQAELARLQAVMESYKMSFRVEISPARTLRDCLGMDLDLVSGTFAFSQSFKSKFQYFCADLVSGASQPLSLLEVQKLSGLAVWASYLSRQPLFIISPLLVHLGYVSNHPAPVTLPDKARAAFLALLPVVKQQHTLGSPLAVDLGLDLFTDSSDGMGGAILYDASGLPPQVWQWTWSGASEAHINVKELAAIRHALLSMPKMDNTGPKGLVRCHTDSMVCLGVLQRMYARSPPLLAVLRDLHSILQQKHLDLDLSYVPTADNPADHPSRVLLSKEDPPLVPALYGMLD